MCETCNGTSEEDLRKGISETILKYGHQIIGIPDGDPRFAYSIGRSLQGMPEFVVTGPISMDVMKFMINEADRLVREGEDVKDGYTFKPDTLLSGYPVRTVAVDPKESRMFQAIYTCGEDISALQLVWPDKQGHFPGDADYDTRFNQPIRAI